MPTDAPLPRTPPTSHRASQSGEKFNDAIARSLKYIDPLAADEPGETPVVIASVWEVRGGYVARFDRHRRVYFSMDMPSLITELAIASSVFFGPCELMLFEEDDPPPSIRNA